MDDYGCYDSYGNDFYDSYGNNDRSKYWQKPKLVSG